MVGVLCVSLAACGSIRDYLDAQPVKRITAETADQACDASDQDDKRLAGAFLRKSSVAGETHVPVLLNGRNNRNGFR